MSEINQNTNITTNTVAKAMLVTDLDDSYKGKEIYSHARNVDSFTHEGNIGTRSNSIANTLCVELPYKFIGSISLNNGKHVVFSGDNTSSEIGIFDEAICIYNKVINDQCLNFKTYSVITGESKILDNDKIIITFRDDVNPIRRMNLSDIPYIYTLADDTCETKIYSKSLNCEEILLFPKISVPSITLTESTGGNLENGTYAVAICYNVKGVKYSDYYSITNRLQLYNTTGNNSFHVKLSDLDREFDTFSLVVIQNSKGVRTTKVVGEYPTSYTDITISDFNGLTINSSELVIVKNTFLKAGLISANSNYLILADLTKRPELNYQKQAMDIEVEYTVEQVSSDYYENDSKDVGYYRDENYDFGIQWLYDTGEWTDKYHIPGRKKTGTDSKLASGPDVYELDKEFSTCDIPEKIEYWQVYNTASVPKLTNNPFKCDRRYYASGEMGYYESTEKYTDNTLLFGEAACTNIRYHKFPDECKIPRYSTVGGKLYLNILGIKLNKIQYPLDRDGKIVPGIVGYRIVRSERKGGNKTVVARGLATNVKKYKDIQNNKEVWYANYPYNDLSPDSFISETQTVFKNKQEKFFKPLVGHFNDKFNFYTPHGSFAPKYRMGNEFKIEAEEIGEVTGNFEPVFGHAKSTLLTQFSFWVAAAIGAAQAYLEASGAGKSSEISLGGTATGIATSSIGPVVYSPDPTGVKTNSSGTITEKNPSLLAYTGTALIDTLTALITAAFGNPARLIELKAQLKTIKGILTFVTRLAIGSVLLALTAIRYAENILDVIYNFTNPIDYAYQYNSHAIFNKSVCSKIDNRRRSVIYQPEYLSSNLHTIRDNIFNNYAKQDSILIELNKPIENPKNIDKTRKTITDFGICGDVKKEVKSQAVAFYATSKVNNLNQYGQLGSVSQVLTHSQLIKVNGVKDVTSPIIYGGDCIITKFAIQTKHQFFSQNLATTIHNELTTNFPDNTPYDYRLYRNIGYPRFWMDSSRYDYSQLLSKNIVNFATFNRTTSSKYNLDCKFQDGENKYRVDNAYFYTSNNGVLEFYVECDYNISFREKTKYPFYSKDNTNLSEIFKSQRLWFPEEFKLDDAYKHFETNEIYARQFRTNFKDSDNDKLRNKNAVIYSLPSYNSQEIDNWQYFLPANYFTFNQSDFGGLVGIHKIDQERLIYLFDRSSPFISTGRDEIQTLDGRKVTIGDGGMFAREPRELMPTDVNYGSSQSKYAFSSNQFGYFYPSQNHGRIFSFTKGLDDITEDGISFWAKKYMPIQLFEHFPNMNKEENPLVGVGYHIAFDSTFNIVYFTKRDFIPKDIYKDSITYKLYENKFYKDNLEISLSSEYFEDVSWTVSYSPKDKGFISYHDWHPDWVIQSENHFLTVKDKGIWKHNSTCNSFCNYYGIDYPFEIEFVDSDGQSVMVRKSIEYFMEAYNYKNNCRDKFHLLDVNFDNLIVHNTEQCSPLYNIVEHPKTKYGSIEYPKRNLQMFDILFTKKEQKYRINQFWDAIKDRGEFTNNEFHIWVNHPSGYKRILNPVAINLDKPEEQRKKFRHTFTKFLLSKQVSGNIKYIFKFLNSKKDISII